MKSRYFILLLLPFLILPGISAVLFEENVTAEYTCSGDCTVRWRFSTNLTIDSFTVGTNELIFNDSQNVSLLPASNGTLNNTIDKWREDVNLFHMVGEDDYFDYRIRYNGQYLKLVYDDIVKPVGATILAVSTSTKWYYIVPPPPDPENCQVLFPALTTFSQFLPIMVVVVAMVIGITIVIGMKSNRLSTNEIKKLMGVFVTLILSGVIISLGLLIISNICVI